MRVDRPCMERYHSGSRPSAIPGDRLSEAAYGRVRVSLSMLVEFLMHDARIVLLFLFGLLSFE